MFERFTERARQVVVLAQDSARQLRHNHIGTDHLLLGLVKEREGLAARALADLGVTESYVLEHIDQGTQTVHSQFQQLPFTSRAKKALELALREGLSLGHNYVGTEHILLGLMRDDRTPEQFDLPPELVRHTVRKHLSGVGDPVTRNQQKEKARAERLQRESEAWERHKTEEENSKDSSRQSSESNPEKVQVTITYGGLTLNLEGDTSGLSSTRISELFNYASKIFKK